MQGSGVIYTAHTEQEPPLTSGEDDPTVALPFNAYSGSGQANVRCYTWHCNVVELQISSPHFQYRVHLYMLIMVEFKISFTSLGIFHLV